MHQSSNNKSFEFYVKFGKDYGQDTSARSLLVKKKDKKNLIFDFLHLLIY